MRALLQSLFLALVVSAAGGLLPGGVLLAGDADAADAFFREGLAAEARTDAAKALEFFKKADAARPNDAVIVQKIAKQLSDLVPDAPTGAQKLQLAQESLKFSQRAVELAPQNPVCVLSLAVSYGKLAPLSSSERKIECARLVKKYAEEALRLNPDYDWAHHVLGRWNCELAQVGGPTRMLAKLFYGGLPSASGAEAVKHLKEAVRLGPEIAAHRIELGLAYLELGDRKAAAESIRAGLALPTRDKHDQTTKQRGQAALDWLEQKRE